jgi:hypothetical protein
MTRILVIGAGASQASELAEKIAKLDLTIVRDVQAYRALACSLDQHSALVLSPEAGPRQAPKFGVDRPYLKRKKGRS